MAKQAAKGLPDRTGKNKSKQPARYNRSEERRAARHQRQLDREKFNEKTGLKPWSIAKAARLAKRRQQREAAA